MGTHSPRASKAVPPQQNRNNYLKIQLHESVSTITPQVASNITLAQRLEELVL
jgi:hypothetical protein